MPAATARTARRVSRRSRPAAPAPRSVQKPTVPVVEKPVVKKQPHEEAGLSAAMYAFCLEYLANGFKAGPAYRVSHPNAQETTCYAEGWRTLRNPKVREYLEPRLTEHWQTRHLSGDEVLARVGIDASSDIRQLFDAQGKLLAPKDWPDDIAQCVEAVEMRPDGSIKVKLTSKTLARRTLLEVTGKVKREGGVDELAAAMRETLEKHAALAGGDREKS